ncbi:MAG: rhodanese-like domain-containing protein [Flavobacteriia bacterium]|nr:rhodanese-like domain-containing protein [Flavobacteriia bacterium]
MKTCILLASLLLSTTLFSQSETFTRSELVNFDDYLSLAQEVKLYREDRLVSLNTYNQLASQPNTVILDTRSDSMYMAKHVKGAIHLNFSDFTQSNLAKLIPDPNTVILIYCNNNFLENVTLKIEDRYFMSKSAPPRMDIKPVFESKTGSLRSSDEETEEIIETPVSTAKPLTLALNIPTFINLYGYGYRNIFELGELVNTNDPRIQFEGTAVEK